MRGLVSMIHDIERSLSHWQKAFAVADKSHKGEVWVMAHADLVSICEDFRGEVVKTQQKLLEGGFNG